MKARSTSDSCTPGIHHAVPQPNWSLEDLAFRPLTEDLIGCSLASATTPDDDIYLVHPESVVDAEAMAAYFQRVEALIAATRKRTATSRRFVAWNGSIARKFKSLTNGTIRAGFCVPERSVNTVWVADRFWTP